MQLALIISGGHGKEMAIAHNVQRWCTEFKMNCLPQKVRWLFAGVSGPVPALSTRVFQLKLTFFAHTIRYISIYIVFTLCASLLHLDAGPRAHSATCQHEHDVCWCGYCGCECNYVRFLIIYICAQIGCSLRAPPQVLYAANMSAVC